MKLRTSLTALAVAGLAVGIAPTPVQADALSDFYKDKTMTLIVSTGRVPGM
jgi:hypothetical protein